MSNYENDGHWNEMAMFYKFLTDNKSKLKEVLLYLRNLVHFEKRVVKKKRNIQ